ncbi:chloramphenicol-sensitive protein RarD [Methylobacterium sp. BE186]|uniref:EamA family transporter RarD n=1 Tax=Methylobacterium sp. BE186 TaxID=2817715 RepID=UPI0028555E90|nr:EamA family transporter RarD [Methylobacterium sp. BE186]MDR7038991.1 chloramphenicol-sensitive protein RarD [Methylobacterium sp. BE186]
MGLVYALGAYLSWGLVVPLHFRLLGASSPGLILAQRIVWSSLFALALVLLWRVRRSAASPIPWPAPLRPRHALLALSAGLIAVNWLLYLRAVNGGHLLDASLGYYINPLVSVGLGALVLGERLRPVQVVAVGIAALGVLIAVVMAGTLPWVALALAVSFSLYGLIRKVVGVDPTLGFLAETLLLVPFAIAYWILTPEPSPSEPVAVLLLALTGVTTALPLIWFAAAAGRLRLATLGLLQYLAPTCLLALSVLAFGERIAPHQVPLFGFIWIALALYAADSWRAARRGSAK